MERQLLLAFCLVASGDLLIGRSRAAGYNEDIWTNITTPSKTCPIFIHPIVACNGLGDQLERFFTGLAVVVRYADTDGATLIVDDTFGRCNVRPAPGYLDTFRMLGIPTSALMNVSQVKSSYTLLREVGMNRTYDQFLNKTAKLECNTLYHIDVGEKACGTYCPYAHTDRIQQIVKPLLRQSHSSRNGCRAILAEDTFPIRDTRLNIVWHIRGGTDVCLHCGAFTSYYYDIYNKFISGGLGRYSAYVRNIVVHEPQFKDRVWRLFRHVPNWEAYSTDNISASVCAFINADILVSGGSSFSLVPSFFAQQHQPVILQDYRNRMWENDKNDPIRYIVSANDSILMHAGAIVSKRGPKQLKKMLETAGVFDRIERMNKENGKLLRVRLWRRSASLFILSGLVAIVTLCFAFSKRFRAYRPAS